MSEKNSIKPLLASVLLEAKNLSHNFDYELFKNINLVLEKKELLLELVEVENQLF